MWNFWKRKSVNLSPDGSLERLQKQIETIQKISSLLVSGSSLDNSLSQITHMVPQVFGINYLGLMLLKDVNTEKNRYTFNLAKTSMPLPLEQIVRLAVGGEVRNIKYEVLNDDENVFVKSVKTRKVQISQDVKRVFLPIMSEKFANRLQGVTRLQIKSLVSIPLIIENDILGVIAIGWNSESYSQNDEIVMRTFANQASIAIYNSQLFERVNTQLKELKQKSEEILSLYHLTTNISESLHVRKVAQNAVDSLPQNEFMIGSFLTEYDKTSNTIKLLAVTQSSLSEQVKKILGDFNQYALNLNDEVYQKSPAKLTILEKRTQYVDDVSSAFSPPIPIALTKAIIPILNIKSIVMSPILSRGEVLGTIGYLLKGKTSQQLERSEKQLLETYSYQISSALENAKNFEKLQESQEKIALQNKELEQKARDLEASAVRERDMMDIVGHELRTPATIVKGSLGFIEMMKRMNKLSDEKLNEYLERSSGAIEREIMLINTFLGAAKIEGDQMQFNPEKFSIPEILKIAVKEQTRSAETKQIKLIYRPAENIPVVAADPVRIREVVDNFINNAIKYSEKGTIEVWCETNDPKDTVSVFIKDQGYGIPKEDQEKLFKKFARLKNYSSIKERAARIVRPGGTGLGLYVSKGIIDVHKGEIGVESTEGVGSTFFFRIPTECKIEEKYIINPIFKRDGDKNIFVKMGLKRAGEQVQTQPSAPPPAVNSTTSPLPAQPPPAPQSLPEQPTNQSPVDQPSQDKPIDTVGTDGVLE